MLDGLEKFTYVSTPISNDEKEQLQRVLLGNANVFSWSHSNMAGIDLTMASHKLNIIAMTKHVRQKIRRFHPDRHQIIQTEVDNLLSASFLKEVKYPEWLANVVAVLKKGGKLRVCVDYKDLSEACPKDSFPLPQIDHIVDASSGHVMLSFMDAFSGYHQIPMHSPDEKKKSLHYTARAVLL